MAVVSRKALKGYFKQGNLPEEAHFSDLIDSMVHQDELVGRPKEPSPSEPTTKPADSDGKDDKGPWKMNVGDDDALVVEEAGQTRLVLERGGQVGIGTQDPAYTLHVAGWVGMQGRIGTYNPSQQPNAAPVSPARPLTVWADGQWHVIVPDVQGCHAFEIVARVTGDPGSKKHAFTHAVAVTSYSGRRKSIRQTQAYCGWNGRRKIRLKWKKQKKRWYHFGSQDLPYSLCIRTGYDYGEDPKGKPIKIDYYITRLWGPPPEEQPPAEQTPQEDAQAAATAS